MNWPDERYVRLYQRDTADWLALSFDAQGLLALLLRKLDRTGRLSLGKHGPKAVAIVLQQVPLWESRIEPALDELLKDGCYVIEGEFLRMRNYVEAQECSSSGKLRTAKWREGHSDAPPRDETSPVSDGTSPNRDESRQGVTDGDSVLSRAVPSRTVPNQKESAPTPAPQASLPIAALPDSTASPFVAFVREHWPDVKAPVDREREWQDACPAVNLLAEARKGLSWERESPRHRKTDHATFLGNWLRRAQDNASRGSPRYGGSGPGPPRAGAHHVARDPEVPRVPGRKQI